MKGSEQVPSNRVVGMHYHFTNVVHIDRVTAYLERKMTSLGKFSDFQISAFQKSKKLIHRFNNKAYLFLFIFFSFYRHSPTVSVLSYRCMSQFMRMLKDMAF